MKPTIDSIQNLSYNDAVKQCPKGCHSASMDELASLKAELLEYEKGKWLWFISSTKTSDGLSVRWVGRGGLGVWSADWGDGLDYCYEDCRVVFVKDVKQ